MKEYFNLNDRARKAWNNNGGKVAVDRDLPVISESGAYKENTDPPFNNVEQHWGDKFIRGRVHYNNAKLQFTWQNLRYALNTAKIVNPGKIHGIIAVENQ